MASNRKSSWSSRKPRSILGSNRDRRRGARPSLESLEGRQLMTLIPLKGPGGTTAPAVLVSSMGDGRATAQQSLGEADNGNYAAAWIDNVLPNVYTQLYSHNGSALTPIAIVGQTYANYLAPDGTGHGTDRAQLAMNRRGDYVVTWTKLYSQVGSQTDIDIMAQVFNADGTRRGGPQVVANTTDVEYQPSVGIDGAGDFVVAYTDWNGSSSHVYAVFCGSNGSRTTVSLDGTPVPGSAPSGPSNPWGAGNSPILLTTYVNHQPSVSMNDSGHFVVAYTQDLPGGQQDVVARRYDAAASPQSYLFTVASTSGHDLEPSVALNDAGQFVIAYTEGNNPLRTLGEEQAAMGEVTDVATSYIRRGPIILACYHSGSDVLAATYNADGSLRATTPVAITSKDEYNPSVAINAEGRFTIAYSSGSTYLPGHGDVTVEMAKLRTFDPLGRPAPGEVPVSLTPIDGRLEGNWDPSVAINGNGDVIALYNHWGASAGGITRVNAFAQAFQTNPYRIVPQWGDINSSTGIQLTNGQSFSLPITIYRDPGYTGDVTLAAIGLPAGVSAVMSDPDPSQPAVEQRTLTFTVDPNVRSDGTAVALVASFGADPTSPDVTVPIKVQVTAAHLDSVTTYPAPNGTLLKGNWATLAGAGLVPGSRVFFGASGTVAQIGWSSSNGTWFQAQLPPDATDGFVKVVTPYGVTLTSPISYTLSDGAIDDLNVTEGQTPRNLQPGTDVILYGTNFAMSDKIQFGGDPNTSVAALQAQPSSVNYDHTMLYVSVPRDALTGVITDFKADGAHLSSSQTFTVGSYRNTYGFNFANFTFDVGKGNVDDLFDPGVLDQPSAAALAWNLSARDVGLKGACFGMALASLKFQEHPSWVDGGNGLPDGVDAKVNNLNLNGQLKAYIEAEHLAQFSQNQVNAKEDYRDQNRSDSASVYNAIVPMLQGGDHPLICIKNTDGSGHCVVAYDVSGDPNGGFKIYVYDPNRQYDAQEASNPTLHVQNEDQSVINVSASGWSFILGGSQTWTNSLDNLTITSASSIPDHPDLPDTLAGLVDDIFNHGPAATPAVATSPAAIATSRLATAAVSAAPVATTSGIEALPTTRPTPKPASAATASHPEVVRIRFRTSIAQAPTARAASILPIANDTDGLSVKINRRGRHA